MKINLSTADAQTLGQLLDMAVKAGGLQTAPAALYFANMINDAARIEAAEIAARAVAADDLTDKS